MGKHNTKKYDIVREVLKSTPVESKDGKTFRQRCIEVLVSEHGFPVNGASTYFSTIAAEMGLTSSKSNRSRSTTSSIAVSYTARESAGEMDVTSLSRVPMNMEIYSMVTCDSRKVAIDVRCFNDKSECLDMCNRLNKHFVRGWQKVGSYLNVVYSAGNVINVIKQAMEAESESSDEDVFDPDLCEV
ncbi:MAG: hypothetical protein KDH96_00530 [Candidatus Riesia sp.]|nr:hypothetical protein [Candidatus Riesia sp.]